MTSRLALSLRRSAVLVILHEARAIHDVGRENGGDETALLVYNMHPSQE